VSKVRSDLRRNSPSENLIIKLFEKEKEEKKKKRKKKKKKKVLNKTPRNQ
jgi:hypothetical protein